MVIVSRRPDYEIRQARLRFKCTPYSGTRVEELVLNRLKATSGVRLPVELKQMIIKAVKDSYKKPVNKLIKNFGKVISFRQTRLELPTLTHELMHSDPFFQYRPPPHTEGAMNHTSFLDHWFNMNRYNRGLVDQGEFVPWYQLEYLNLIE